MKTLLDSSGMPVLELIKENGDVTIYEADDLDHEIRIPVTVIEDLVQLLQQLK